MLPGLTERRTVSLWMDCTKLAKMGSLASVITTKLVLQYFSYKILMFGFGAFSSGHDFFIKKKYGIL